MQQKGFFGALFDFSFSSFITTKIVKVLYVIAIILTGLIALVYVVVAFGADARLGLFTLVILAPLAFLFSVIYTRVLLELFIAIFRIMETNVEPSRSPARPTPAVAAAVAAAARSAPVRTRVVAPALRLARAVGPDAPAGSAADLTPAAARRAGGGNPTETGAPPWHDRRHDLPSHPALHAFTDAPAVGTRPASSSTPAGLTSRGCRRSPGAGLLGDGLRRRRRRRL